RSTRLGHFDGTSGAPTSPDRSARSGGVTLTPRRGPAASSAIGSGIIWDRSPRACEAVLIADPIVRRFGRDICGFLQDDACRRATSGPVRRARCAQDQRPPGFADVWSPPDAKYRFFASLGMLVKVLPC